MDAQQRSLLLMLVVVLLVLFGAQFVNFGGGQGVTVQGVLLVFGLGTVAGVMLGAQALRSGARYE